MVSVSVCQAGRPDLRLVCFRKVQFYQGAIDLFPPVLMTGSTKAIHVLSCLCDNACKRSLAICRKSRASCPVSRLLSVPMCLHVLNRDVNMIQTNYYRIFAYLLNHEHGPDLFKVRPTVCFSPDDSTLHL